MGIDNLTNMWSGLLALIFIFMGVQVRMGKTEFLGKNAERDIKPEVKQAYCKEISIPIFLMAAVEIADLVLQYTVDGAESWSLLLLGAGILIGIIWITMVQRKYSKM